MSKAKDLTDKNIANLKPKNERYEVKDGHGLFIRVSPTGNKTWVFRYRFGDDLKPRRMTLGTYPRMTLASAREVHARAMQDLQKGIDPGAMKQEEKAKRKEEPTFKELLEEFWITELSKAPSGKARRSLIEKDALPAWASRKVKFIKRRDAVILLDGVRDRAPITANRLQSVLVRMFNFASERGIIDFPLLAGLKREKEKSRARVLTDAEIKKLWQGLDLENKAIDIYAPSKLALKMILLSGQRPGEVCGMAFDELSEDRWTIPESRTKNGEVQEVPLTAMMKEIIEQARVYAGESRFVFTSPRSPLYNFKKPKIAKPKEVDLPLSRLALSRALQRHCADMEIENPFTPHDLRRTLRTRLAELGVSDIVAERVLGHKLQGMLAIYNRHDYAVEKRQALERWENRLREILEMPDEKQNVIPFEVRHD